MKDFFKEYIFEIWMIIISFGIVFVAVCFGLRLVGIHF